MLDDGSGQDWLDADLLPPPGYVSRELYESVRAERDALRAELAELNARSCKTCKWHIDGSTECRQDVLIPVGLPTDKFWCSLWKEE
jgi:hypothetical protein